MENNNIEYKWKKLFASKRFHTEDGTITLTPLEQQELIDDLSTLVEDEIRIVNVNYYKDGGTLELETDRGVYCFDNRIKTKTKYCLYNGYPFKNNSNIIHNSTSIEKALIKAMEKYDGRLYKDIIKKVIEYKSLN